jgi:PRTRC genetic system protein E
VFVELMPLLAHRTVLITVARENDTMLRVNLVPKRTNEDENAALTTPLSFAGTPEELDRDFCRELAAYADAHQRLGSTLAEAKAAMEAAAKAAQEEAKRKTEERRKTKAAPCTPAPAPSDTPQAATAAANATQPNTTGSSGNAMPGQPIQGGLRL